MTEQEKGSLKSKLQEAHKELWKRFVTADGLLLDYTGLDGTVELPTDEECRRGFPNGLGWWTPIENGAFFTGLYLAALCNRWERYREEEIRKDILQLVHGLLKLEGMGNNPGFIGRGASKEGNECYEIGSDDQTGPWIYGLWCFLRSSVEAENVKRRVADRLETVLRALNGYDWEMPCRSGPEFRGNWKEGNFRDAVRLLFGLRVLERLSSDSLWKEEFKRRADELIPESGKTRKQLCLEGLSEQLKSPWWQGQLWICVGSQLMLKALWEMEPDPQSKREYEEALKKSAEAVEPLKKPSRRIGEFGKAGLSLNWRRLGDHWKPQSSVAQWVSCGEEQYQSWARYFLRREEEVAAVREPLCAMYIQLIAEEGGAPKYFKQEELSFLKTIPWSEQYTSSFFLAESVAYESIKIWDPPFEK